jgi:hypothetical protein
MIGNFEQSLVASCMHLVATRDVVEFEGKRIGNRTFTVNLPDELGAGAVTSSNSASIGKMYTFRVVE